jgi:hypothetical protein
MAEPNHMTAEREALRTRTTAVEAFRGFDRPFARISWGRDLRRRDNRSRDATRPDTYRDSAWTRDVESSDRSKSEWHHARNWSRRLARD